MISRGLFFYTDIQRGSVVPGEEFCGVKAFFAGWGREGGGGRLLFFQRIFFLGDEGIWGSRCIGRYG